ncbi:hypothetical protein EYF80_003698 [Liparis tanakae]|uniref:Uncharacterized protein n=1 Tax=Liparis tanakae TaxID=230148 RepID=A0A4Z2J7G5_9TELE|nr:hypothetical protein EYF80_003698 [Liparis tanakae]
MEGQKATAKALTWLSQKKKIVETDPLLKCHNFHNDLSPVCGSKVRRCHPVAQLSIAPFWKLSVWDREPTRSCEWSAAPVFPSAGDHHAGQREWRLS